MTMERKQFALDECEVKEDGDARTIEGFGSTFGNTDSYGDIVLPGAFAKSISARKPAMLWQHRTDQPVGVWDAMEEQKKGLYLKGRIFGTQLGNDAYTLAKGGAVTGLSIGFSTKKFSIDAKKGTRQLGEVDLFEVSLVTFPANDKAQITNVKSKPETIRQFEDFLREAGFSQKDATTVALRGFKALSDQGEPDDEVTLSALRAITTATNMLKGITA